MATAICKIIIVVLCKKYGLRNIINLNVMYCIINKVFKFVEIWFNKMKTVLILMQ